MATKQQQNLKLVVKEDEPEERSKIELQGEIIILRARGYPYLKIAKKLNMAKNTVMKYASELEEEIAAARALELELLYEQYYLSKEKRVKFLGQQIKLLEKELKSRDLSEVPTEKLLELLLKYHSQLKEEYIEPKPLSPDEIEELKALRE